MSAAEALAAGGLAVFPCRFDKAPATPRGFHDATRDPAAARDLFARYGGPLIGVATGAASGFDVLDLDPRHGSDTWWQVNRNRLPETRTHATRSGGLHLLFQHAEGMRNSVGKIAPGCDVRGDGGYIIWWPGAGLAVSNADLLGDWPGWLLAAINPPPRQRPAAPPMIRGTGYAAMALRRAVEAVARAAPGTRNDTLNREAFTLSRFARNGELDPQTIANALAVAGMASGLCGAEIAATLASAFRAAGISQ
jgi:hypothetical protein